MTKRQVPIGAGGALMSEESVNARIAENQMNEEVGHPDELRTASVVEGEFCGFPIRAKSAGVMRMLQNSGHPIYHGTESAGDIGHNELLFVLFLRTFPDQASLIGWIEDGLVQRYYTAWLSEYEMSDLLPHLGEIAEFVQDCFEELGQTEDAVNAAMEKKTK